MRRTWNEKANEYQRDPYTQAKAQLENVYNENRDRGLDTAKPTEQAIQVAAAQIAKGPREDAEKRLVRETAEVQRAKKVRKNGG